MCLLSVIQEPANLSLGLNFKKANWIKFEENMNKEIALVESEQGVDEWNSSLIKAVWSVAEETIPKKKILQRGSMVP